LKLVAATLSAKPRQEWILRVGRRFGARVRLLHTKPSRNPSEILQMFEITVSNAPRKELIRYLQLDPSVSELEITDSSRGRLTGLIRSRGVISRCIADSDCFLVYASSDDGLSMIWKILGSELSVQRLLARLERRGIRVKVSDISEVRSNGGLTDRQEWILRRAFEKGYFDDPKKTHLRALAQQMKMTHPALHESLRKTERKILEEYFNSIMV
jgi:predicted DNA binding protein